MILETYESDHDLLVVDTILRYSDDLLLITGTERKLHNLQDDLINKVKNGITINCKNKESIVVRGTDNVMSYEFKINHLL